MQTPIASLETKRTIINVAIGVILQEIRDKEL
jgi:hypothetical protein